MRVPGKILKTNGVLNNEGMLTWTFSSTAVLAGDVVLSVEYVPYGK